MGVALICAAVLNLKYWLIGEDVVVGGVAALADEKEPIRRGAVWYG